MCLQNLDEIGTPGDRAVSGDRRIANAIRRARAGFAEENRPQFVYVLGPTGVGRPNRQALPISFKTATRGVSGLPY